LLRHLVAAGLAAVAIVAVLVLDVDRAGHAAGVGAEYRAAAVAVDRMGSPSYETVAQGRAVARLDERRSARCDTRATPATERSVDTYRSQRIAVARDGARSWSSRHASQHAGHSCRCLDLLYVDARGL
jgi:hypothetical protein